MSNCCVVKPALAPIQAEQLEMLHEASMKILADTGINIHHPQCRVLLRDAGARVEDDLRVYFPAELVEQALSTAPSRIDVYDRRLRQKYLPTKKYHNLL